MNPWINIWVHPRATIRHIVETDASRYVIPLAMIAGVTNVLDNASQRSYGDDFGIIGVLLLALIAGPLGGVFSLYITGGLLKWSGGLLGGIGESDEVRAAIAWSSLIRSIGAVLLIPNLILFGAEFFTKETPIMDAKVDANPLYAVLVVSTSVAVIVAAIVLTIWYIVAFLHALGEVHQFSAWKALGAVIIGFGVIIVPILIVVALLSIAIQT